MKYPYYKIQKDLNIKGYICCMITKQDIDFAINANRKLKEESIILSNLSSTKFREFTKNRLGIEAKKVRISSMKNTKTYDNLLLDARELFELGYGTKFISLCISLKYKMYIHTIFFHKTVQKNRLSFVINDSIFNQLDVICKGRLFYNRIARGIFLSFKCKPLYNLSKNERVGVKIFYDTPGNKIFIKRDDRSSKSLVCGYSDIIISASPIPKNTEKILKFNKNIYTSKNIDVCFEADDFGFDKTDLIDDKNARKLYPHLQKYGFILEKKRITCSDRSCGDLHIYRNGKKYIIEISNVFESPPTDKNYHSAYNRIRDNILGKITRICLLNKCNIIFIFNKTLEDKKIINEDFVRVIEHFKPNLILTTFNDGWEKEVANEIHQ